MTNLEVIFDIRKKLSVNSDDRSFEFTDERILFTYENVRAMILTNSFNKKSNYDSSLYQTIKLDLIEVDRSECGNVPSICKVKRSSVKLPNLPLWLNNGYMIESVKGLDLISKKFTYIDYPRVSTLFSNPLISKSSVSVWAFLRNGYLYFFSKNNLFSAVEQILFTAVFSSPRLIREFAYCEEGDCTQYPINSQYHEIISNYVVQALIKRVPSDMANDGSNSEITSGGNKQPQPQESNEE